MTTLECLPRSDDYISIGGRFYHRIDTNVDFDQAKSICERHGTQLLQIFQPRDLEILSEFGMREYIWKKVSI